MGGEGSFVGSFIISGGAAVVSKTAAAPVERVKLMLQSQGEMMKQGRISREYRGIVDCFIQIFKHEGVAAFWRGNTANCLRYFPTQVKIFNLRKKPTYAEITESLLSMTGFIKSFLGTQFCFQR